LTLDQAIKEAAVRIDERIAVVQIPAQVTAVEPPAAAPKPSPAPAAPPVLPPIISGTPAPAGEKYFMSVRRALPSRQTTVSAITLKPHLLM
jgi:hypothetical protein